MYGPGSEAVVSCKLTMIEAGVNFIFSHINQRYWIRDRSLLIPWGGVGHSLSYKKIL